MTTNNPYLIERLAGIQQSLMAQFEGSKNLPSAMKGVERETLLREFFQQLFPAHRRFSNGVITDSVGNLSGQIDIAIEYGHLPSFPMPKSDERLILAESVAFVIEVKSDLSSQWGEVENTTRSVNDPICNPPGTVGNNCSYFILNKERLQFPSMTASMFFSKKIL